MNTYNRRRFQLSIAGAVVIALGGAFLALHTRSSPAAAEATQSPAVANPTPPSSKSIDLSSEALANMDLHYAKAELRPAVHTIAATGVLAFNAKRLAQLSSPSKGRIISIDVAAGDHVHAGQRLAALDEFDLSDVRSQVATGTAAVADAKSTADAANAALQRGTELLATGGIAQSELDRRRAAAVDAQATLKSRQADLQKWVGMQDRLMPIGSIADRGNRGYSSGTATPALVRLSPRDSLGALVAPFDGVVNNVGAAEGDMVDASTPVVTIADLSTMWLQANVPERDAAEVRPGQTVSAHIDAYPNRQFTGRVIDVAAQADPNTGTVAVRCELPNSDGALRANMFANVDIDVPLGGETVLVPEVALQDVNGQTVVFTPSGNGRFIWHVVHTGYAAQGMTEVVSGLTPIYPKTGKPGKEVMVDDPYNMYFTPDGKEAIVVAEAHARLDFRDPHTMSLKSSLEVPECRGINHADFSIDGKYALFTCEFGGKLAKIDLVNRKVAGYLELATKGMPQDIRVSPDGKVFYVADMMADGVYVVDGDSFTKVGFIKTGVGTHGLYPSRDGTKLYVANRGSNLVHGPRHGKGSVSVIDFSTRKVLTTWPIPGGGSPDMGNVSADGKTLWLSGRFDDVVYAIDTTTGTVISIPVGMEPHGLTVWPQPGRYSLGHTGNMR